MPPARRRPPGRPPSTQLRAPAGPPKPQTLHNPTPPVSRTTQLPLTQSDTPRAAVVAKNPSGEDINALEQHIRNLLTPSTPDFFNTLYDPYAEGTDFVRGYPFR